MTIGVLKEPPHETRVSLLPEAAGVLTKKNLAVLVESGAGVTAFARDTDYESAGASIRSRNEVLRDSDVVLSLHGPSKEELTLLGRSF